MFVARFQVFILLEAEIQISSRSFCLRNEQLRVEIQHEPHLILQPSRANP